MENDIITHLVLNEVLFVTSGWGNDLFVELNFYSILLNFYFIHNISGVAWLWICIFLKYFLSYFSNGRLLPPKTNVTAVGVIQVTKKVKTSNNTPFVSSWCVPFTNPQNKGEAWYQLLEKRLRRRKPPKLLASRKKVMSKFENKWL